MISGVGFASTKSIGFGAMPMIMSCVTEPAMDKPIKRISALQGIVQRARVRRDGEFGLVDIHTIFALMVDDAARIQHEDILAGDAERFEEFAGGDCAGAGAVDDDFDVFGMRLPVTSRALTRAAPEMMAVPC